MNFDDLFNKLFWAVFVLVAGSFVWKMFRNGGFRGAMFGAPVEKTVGEVVGIKAAMHSTSLKVHQLAPGSEGGLVGVEFVAKSLASYQLAPITLSREAALELALLLQTAAGVVAKRPYDHKSGL